MPGIPLEVRKAGREIASAWPNWPSASERPIGPYIGQSLAPRYRLRIETLLNQLTETAEQWADSGQRCENQMAVVRQGAPLGGYAPPDPVGLTGTQLRVVAADARPTHDGPNEPAATDQAGNARPGLAG